MTKKYDASELRKLFGESVNISKWIKSSEGESGDSLAAIQYSYDIQAGSYVDAYKTIPGIRGERHQIGLTIGGILDSLGVTSLLDAGVGEATTLAEILTAMRNRPQIFAFDASVSRLLYAQHHLDEHGISATLFTGNLYDIPLGDSSVDAVVTVHAVESNGGRERDVLAELFRVARSYVIMLEPSWELGSQATRDHIAEHGYCRSLPEIVDELGHIVTRHEKWPHSFNPVNEASLLVAQKQGGSPTRAEPAFVSPISGNPLVRRSDCWYCPEDGHAFPVIQGITCLLAENAVLASHLQDFD